MRVDEPDRLDGGDAPERGEPLRRQVAERLPAPLELVDLGDQPEKLGGYDRLCQWVHRQHP